MLSDLFKDHDVEIARKTGNTLACPDGRTIMLPDHFGFCNGVIGAIRGVNTALKRQTPEKIWLIGEIIHNPTVNRCLREIGIRMVAEKNTDSLFRTAGQDDIIIVPAFGIVKQLAEQLQHHFPPESIIDTTCSYVKKAWTFIREATDRKYSILVFGNPDHPEIKATVSRANLDRSGIVYLRHLEAAYRFAENLRTGKIDNQPEEDIINFDKLDIRRLALISQTTLLNSDINQVTGFLGQAVKQIGGDFLCPKTICRATQQRQDTALELCRRDCDLILVIGGYFSSNTNQLYRIAKEHATTYFIGSAEMLSAAAVTHYIPEEKREKTTRDWLTQDKRRIGILAGASCPAPDIGAVMRWLRNPN